MKWLAIQMMLQMLTISDFSYRCGRRLIKAFLFGRAFDAALKPVIDIHRIVVPDKLYWGNSPHPPLDKLEPHRPWRTFVNSVIGSVRHKLGTLCIIDRLLLKSSQCLYFVILTVGVCIRQDSMFASTCFYKFRSKNLGVSIDPDQILHADRPHGCRLRS